MMSEAKEREANPAITITVLARRIGRDLNPDPFEVALPQHYRPTAQVLAERIHKYVRPMLMSDNYEVVVDMARKRFTINGGRFGQGAIIIKETADVDA